LSNLLADWNRPSRGKTCYQLNIVGNCATLPETLGITLFRIIQECLTNIAKHAAAHHAEINLAICDETVALTVTDDGKTERLPFSGHKGIGLLGIRERVTALNGRLNLSLAHPHGLRVDVRLPIKTTKEVQA